MSCVLRITDYGIWGYWLAKEWLIWSMWDRRLSRPKEVTEEVRKCWGRDSQVSERVERKVLTFWVSSRCFGLSVLVKMMLRGMPLVPRKLMKSRSIFCGGMRESMSTKTLMRVSRWSM